MKKLITLTALIFAAAATPAAAVDRGVVTATGTLNTGQTFSCTKTHDQEATDDCHGLGGDAKPQIALMERYGATRATFVASVTFGGKPIGTSTRTAQKRADGTWLMTGTNDGGKSWGYVCTSAPVKCVEWESGTASTKAKATRKAKAAARR